MNKKKLVSLLMLITLVTGVLVGCGSSSNKNNNKQTQNDTQTNNVNNTEATNGVNSNTTETETETETDNSETTGDGSKVLIVYYSATGYTENVANAIAEATDGDTFEIIPVDDYTEEDLDWTNDKSRTSVERDNPDDRDVELTSTTVDNWDSYDTVYIGYPIWWGIAAWPMDSFIEVNDFTGKTVIPFCTATSSGIGESGELLAELAGEGDWKEGKRFQSNASADSVKEWVEGLEY